MTHNEAMRLFIYNELKGKIKTEEGVVIGIYDTMKPSDDKNLFWILITSESDSKIQTNVGDIRQCIISLQVITAGEQYINKEFIDMIGAQIDSNLFIKGVGKTKEDAKYDIGNLRYTTGTYSIGQLVIGNTKTTINKLFNLAANVARKY